MKSGWTRLPFVEAVADESGGNLKTPQREYVPEGRFAVVDQGKELVSGYTNNESRLWGGELPAIIFGDHTRCLKYVDFPFCMGADGVKVLRPNVEADVKYLYHFLRQIDLHNGGYDRHFKYLKRESVWLPPLPEQRRIAEVLDRAEALRAKRRAALAQLDTLTQSLFLDRFGDPVGNDHEWPAVTVADFVAGFESGKSLVADDEEDATSVYRVLKVSAVTSLEYRSGESKALPADYVPPRSHFVQTGDLLFSRANTAELIGATAFVHNTPPNLILPDKLWRFVWPTQDRSDPHFVRFLFQQPKFRFEVGRRATGTSGSMKNISQEKVLGIEVGLPPLLLQREFARQVAAVEKLKAAHRASLAELDALFASLQHRAFRGEL